MSENTQTRAFIEKVHLKGYKSIKDLEVRLNDGLNIIIGPNGSGKTNFVEFLKYMLSLKNNRALKTPYVTQITFQTFNGIFILEEVLDHKLRQKEKEKEIDFSPIKTSLTNVNANTIHDITDGPLFLHLRRHHRPLLGLYYNIFFSYKSEFEDTFMFTELGEIKVDIERSLWEVLPRIFEDKIYELDDFPFEDKDKTALLPTIIQEYLFINKKTIRNLSLYSPIKSVRLSESLKISKIEDGVKLEYMMLEFYVNATWLKWNQLSDGTKRIFEIIYKITSDDRPELIVLEEPENGVHPDQLQLLLDFLIEQSKEKQIILTTHAPEVLNVLNKDELDRIIVTRYDEVKGTKMHHLSEKTKKKGQAYMEKIGHLSAFWLYSSLEKYVEEENE